MVEWHADQGQEVLDELFRIPLAVGQGGAGGRALPHQPERPDLPQHPLQTKNAVCHIAFGRAYAEGIQGGSKLSAEDMDGLGLNNSETHNDLMIGAETMKVIGICADGHEVTIMENGKFLDDVLA